MEGRGAPQGPLRRFQVSGEVRRGRVAAAFSHDVDAADAGDAFERARAALAGRHHVPARDVHVGRVELLPEDAGSPVKPRADRKVTG